MMVAIHSVAVVLTRPEGVGLKILAMGSVAKS